MKKVRFKRFDGSIVGLIILLCFFLIPGIIYWAVKRREFLYDIPTEDEVVDELEKLRSLIDKGVIDELTYEKKRDRIVKLAKKANKAADKRKPKPKVLSKFNNKISALEYVVKSAEKIDIVGEKSFDKALKRL